MRPLIEILEDERTSIQKLESIHRYMSKTDDDETWDILKAQKVRVDCELNDIRNEIREYFEAICLK